MTQAQKYAPTLRAVREERRRITEIVLKWAFRDKRKPDDEEIKSLQGLAIEINRTVPYKGA